MARTKTPANIVGPQVAALRQKKGFTQEAFAAHCQLRGFDVSRGTISQIEARLRCVTDDEVLKLSEIFGVSTEVLYPKKAKRA